MSIIELRIELIRKGKTATWLAQQLGYSNTYMYKVVKEQNKKELDRIQKILKEMLKNEWIFKGINK